VGSRHPTSRDLNLAFSIDPGAFADAGGPVGIKRPAGQAIAFPLQENQEAIMTIQFPRKGVAESRLLKSGSSLVRRVVQAQDDPAKQRIRAWLRALDNEQLSSLGLTSEDIAVLRGTQTLSSSRRSRWPSK
jgi:hypothetical protein